MRTLRRRVMPLLVLTAASLVGASILAAGPDPGVPPRPFFPDYFFGTVMVQGALPPQGTQLVACIDDCDTVFASAPVRLGELGNFSGLTVGPKDEGLVDHTVRFYIVNEHGRIAAAETVVFAGALELQRLQLTFHQPLPGPAVPPNLPAVGDWVVPILSKGVIAVGAVMALTGVWLLVASQRRGFWWGRPPAGPSEVQVAYPPDL